MARRGEWPEGVNGPKGSNVLFVLYNIVIAWIKFEMAIVRVGSICLFICNRKTCLCVHVREMCDYLDIFDYTCARSFLLLHTIACFLLIP